MAPNQIVVASPLNLQGGYITCKPSGHVSSDAQRLLELMNAILGSAFRQILWRKAAELELTYSQAQVLFYVEQHSGCIMGEVAKVYDVTLPAITQIVDRLEQKGFLTRRNDRADRRVCPLDFTTEGEILVRELHALQIEASCQCWRKCHHVTEVTYLGDWRHS